MIDNEVLNEIIRFINANPIVVNTFFSSLVFFSKGIVDTIKFNNFSKVRNVKRIELPPELKNTEQTISDDELLKNVLDDRVSLFYQRLKENVPQENLINLKNNVQGLAVHHSISNELNKKFKKIHNYIEKHFTIMGGRYSVRTNKIYIYDDSFKIVIFHELMHMASSVNKNGITYSGLMQSRPNSVYIGSGINEGVTEVLTEKYFGDYMQEDGNAYPYETMITRNLGQIIGSDFIENSYFKNDLSSVINEISKYSSIEQAKKFIIDLDFLISYSYSYFPYSIVFDKKEKLKETINRANLFLINCYKKKLDMLNLDNKEELLNNFINTFKYNPAYDYTGYDFNDSLSMLEDKTYMNK